MIPKKSRENFKKFQKLLFFEKGKFFIAAFLLAVSTSLGFLNPLYPKFFIDNVLNADPCKGTFFLKILVLVIIGCFLLTEITNLSYRYLIFVIQNKIAFKIELRLFKHIMNLPISFFKETGAGYTMSRVATDVAKLQGLMIHTILDFLKSLFSLIVGFGIAIYLSWKLTLLYILTIPLFIASVLYFAEKTQKKSEELMESYARKSSVLQEVFTGIVLIKSFLIETMQINKIAKALKNIIRIQFEWEVINYLSLLTISLVGVAGPVLIFWLGGQQVILKQMTLGSMISFTILSGYIYDPIRQLITINNSVQNSLGALNRIYEYLDMPDENQQDSQKEKIKTPVFDKSFPQEVIFEEVSFSYEKDKTEILKNISLRVKTGETLVFVGKSGAGKTTLLNLLPRFYHPQSGKILFDDININDMGLRCVRSMISVITQDTFIFSGTIKDNVKFGRPDAGDDEVISACDFVGLSDKERELPDGIETKIGAQGAKLSGGQKQRISIARAFLKNSKIIIFDEATSQLDTISESRIRQAIENLSKDRIVFIIAHRLSLVKSAHVVAVMEKGKIIDMGTHKELYDRCGLYQNLCREYLYE